MSFSDPFSTPLLFLSPMAGFTDAAFRLLCREQGADMSTTEMISAKALCYENARTEALLHALPEEGPLCVQLFGREPDVMAEAVERVQAEMGAFLWAVDLNMGCPAHKIVRNGEGSALMLQPALAARIVCACVAAARVPVTVKIRKGWDEKNVNAVDFARRMAGAGAALVTVHGRTRFEQYGGKADRDVVRAVREAVDIPVVGNGDVVSGIDALDLLNTTGCAGLAVGRGALGNPWIFAEIKAALAGKTYTPPTNKERAEMAIRHAELVLAQKGPHGLVELRKHLGFYLRGTKGAAERRARLQEAKTIEEIRQILT